ncbi:MAG: mycothiol synthase [Actinomycetota bacterium]
MLRVRVTRTLSPHDRQAVEEFLGVAHSLDGIRMSDHLLADLAHGPRPGFVAALAFDEHEHLVGYAQASSGNEGSVVDVIAQAAYQTRLELLRAVLDQLPADEAGIWWSHDGDADRPLAEALALVAHRSLLQMGRALPLDAATHLGSPVDVRPFVVGHDETSWLEVNNAAFAWHGEQGGWDESTIEQREREPWFDPDGFLLHERDGRLAAFCWTKLHDDDDHLVGEIYVIAVHPDFHGLGLGRSMTVAGLQHLQAKGATEAMLYVDGENASAVDLYLSLGFERAHTDQAYRRAPQP